MREAGRSSNDPYQTSYYMKEYCRARVGILKRGGALLMRNTNNPPFLREWDLYYEAEANSFTVVPIPRLQGRTPHEHMTV